MDLGNFSWGQRSGKSSRWGGNPKIYIYICFYFGGFWSDLFLGV